MQRRHFIALTSVAAAATASNGWAANGDKYPSKAIRIVVPFPAGGGTDALARAVGQRLGTVLAQSVVIDNRGGANGLIGSEAVAKADPDGYSLLLTIASHTIAPAIYKKMPYNIDKDFAPVSLLAKYPYLLTVPATMPVNTFSEFVAYVKANPKRVSYASSGTGSGPHLGMELFAAAAGLDMVHVPYKGAAPANNDLAGGQVQAMLNNLLAASAMLRAKKIKVLAVTSAARSPALPDVPTVAESGYPGFEVDGWYGLFAPAGTPAPVVSQLHRSAVQAINAPDVMERLSGDGAIVVGSTPQEFAAFVVAEKTKWAAVAAKANVTVD
ncbi:tripartite tricarboxylate transporter substrate binding protein [Hydrogenophaga sp.]|uniref:tripartite tricarboxylate transporter substrate binding protein n=1 Tax=Hydrogenophaga sp. TaxID=1904254 RepID=UPI00271D6581|nr:tripartite tricarboxylate transporter substrate binding protein [Hydrogenophaga sp.]MDO9435482.1 tripartite tricarboxylate transporter substrate binding protein [Hydrogenophaga sp.]